MPGLVEGGRALLDGLGGVLEGGELEAPLLLGLSAGDGGDLDLLGLALLHGLGDGHGHHDVLALGLEEGGRQETV